MEPCFVYSTGQASRYGITTRARREWAICCCKASRVSRFPSDPFDFDLPLLQFSQWTENAMGRADFGSRLGLPYAFDESDILCTRAVHQAGCPVGAIFQLRTVQ